MGLIGHHGLLRSKGGIILNDNYALANGFTSDPNDPAFKGVNVKGLYFDPIPYDWSQDFTVEFKFNATLLTYFPYLFYIGNSAGDYFRIVKLNTTQLIIISRIGGVNKIDLRPTAQNGVEYHLIMSMQRNVLCLVCMNGSFMSTATTVECVSDVTKGGFMGAYGDSNIYCNNGYQYDCRIYIGKAASNAEMQDMYNSGNRIDATPAMLPYLKSDYRLNQVNGNLALDRGPLENHGTLHNYTDAETQQGAGFWIAR